jgi:hypothetical protein
MRTGNHVKQFKINFCKRKSNDKIFFQFDGYRRGRNRMVVGFITNYAISAYHH